jgi:CheY-like chemotaxis protein
VIDQQPDFVIDNSGLSTNFLEGKVILYVDDEYVNYLYFAELLSETGATIIRAYSTQQVVIRLSTEPDVCLVMIEASAIKRMSRQIITQIRQIIPDIPIIGIIGQDYIEGVRAFLKTGCDLYLNRHIDDIHLIEIINELLIGSPD